MPNENINKQVTSDYSNINEDTTSDLDEQPTAKSPGEGELASSVEERASQVPDTISQETSATEQPDSSSAQEMTESTNSDSDEQLEDKDNSSGEKVVSPEHQRASQVPDTISQETSATEQPDSSSAQEMTESTNSDSDEQAAAKPLGEGELVHQVPDTISPATSATDQTTDSSSAQDTTEDTTSDFDEQPTQEASENEKNDSLEQIVKSLQQQVANQSGQIQNLQAQIYDLQDEINNPNLTFIKNKLKQQETEIKKDRQELDKYLKQAKSWAKRNEILQQNIKHTVDSSYSLLSKCKKIKEQLPKDLQEELQKRQGALEIIGKMLGRLPEQFNEMLERLPNNANAEESISLAELPVATKQELIELSSSEKTEDLQKAIVRKLKDVGIERWQIISQVRDVADKYRKTWLHFVEKKILPILDGINDGNKLNATFSQQLKDNSPDYENNLNDWFQTYPELREILLKMLNLIKVYPIKVELGTPIDYDRHEPFEVQIDKKLNNEDIKEVTREGYEYETEADRERLVLRSAQVVVVKNN